MKNKLLLAILSIGLSGVAFAADTDMTMKNQSEEKPKQVRPEHHKGEHMKKHWEHADKDKDGAISKAEAAKMSEERFDKMDLNKDGKVTKEEMREFHQKHKQMKEHHNGPRSEGKPEHKGPPPAPEVKPEVK